MKLWKLFTILTLIVVFVGQALAGTRNVFGYILGLGTNVHAVSYITVKSGNTTYSASWAYFFWLCPGGLRWWCNGLPTDRYYTVTVQPNGLDSRSQTFWLPSGRGDYKVPDFRF